MNPNILFCKVYPNNAKQFSSSVNSIQYIIARNTSVKYNRMFVQPLITKLIISIVLVHKISTRLRCDKLW